MKTNHITGIVCFLFSIGILTANAQVNPMNKKDTTKHLYKDTSHVKPGMYKDTMHMKNDTPPNPGSIPPPHFLKNVLVRTELTAKKEE